MTRAIRQDALAVSQCKARPVRRWHVPAATLRRAAIVAVMTAGVAAPAQAATPARSGTQGASLSQTCASATILGTAGDDTLVGTPGNDVICGLGGNDVLLGADGNDILDGGLGADVVSGGAGVDVVDYSWRSAGIVVTLLFDDANDGQPGEGDRVRPDVENVLGTAHGDSITGSELANVFTGNGGDDELVGFQGNDLLLGGAGNDTLRGARDNDHLLGGDGDDTLFPGGYAGTDLLEGGAGNDTADYSYFDGVRVSLDNVANDGSLDDIGDNGLPALSDNVRDDVENVAGGEGADVITGSAQANVLVGNGGDDELLGRRGEDTLSGGDGNDFLRAGHAFPDEDTVTCGAGIDTATYDDSDSVAGDCEYLEYVPPIQPCPAPFPCVPPVEYPGQPTGSAIDPGESEAGAGV